ncbi:MAG TPA: hypothetical protein VJC13_02535 [Candidatus Paceibacterota bacterium]
MRNYKKEKIIARKLRNQGLSYGEISKKTGSTKSTIRYWCLDIVLTPKNQKRLYTRQIEILSKGPYGSRQRREAEIQEIRKIARKEISFPLSDQTYRLFGAALYWAEGNKVSDFTVTNSDPLLIQFMCRWFCKIFKITPDNLGAHLNIYQDQNDLQIKKFWSDITNIPINNFGKSFIKPVNKNYKKNTLYYGTIKVRVNKGTDFRHRVFTWIDMFLKDSKINVEKIERKWYKLKDNYTRS